MHVIPRLDYKLLDYPLILAKKTGLSTNEYIIHYYGHPSKIARLGLSFMWNHMQVNLLCLQDI